MPSLWTEGRRFNYTYDKLKCMTPSKEVIRIMESRGWTFEETRGDERIPHACPITVSFTREEWRGRSLESPLTMSRSGTLDHRWELITDAARAAAVLHRYRMPGRYWDPEERSQVWREGVAQNQRR